MQLNTVPVENQTFKPVNRLARQQAWGRLAARINVRHISLDELARHARTLSELGAISTTDALVLSSAGGLDARRPRDVLRLWQTRLAVQRQANAAGDRMAEVWRVLDILNYLESLRR